MIHSGAPLGFKPSDIGPEKGRRLVVVLHGAWIGPSRMRDVVQAVGDAYAQEPGLDLYVPPLDYAKPFGRKPAAKIVSEILDDMDAICADPGRYQHIVLIG